MKRLIFIALLSIISLTSKAFSQETQQVNQVRQQSTVQNRQQPAVQARQQGNQQVQQNNIRARELELVERELQLEQMRAEINFQRERQNIELDRLRRELEAADKMQNDKLVPLLLLVLIVNILCAVWVYQDIRKLNNGSGIWIVIALIAGLFGTLVYAVIRIGEKSKKTT